jgi:hypothetical protein
MFRCFALLLVLSTNSIGSQTLPSEVRKVLDHSFTDWQVKSDSSLDQDEQMNEVWIHFQCFYKCNLNNDTLPDYALVVQSTEDSEKVESYLALIAEGTSYRLYRLWSTKASTSYDTGFDFAIEARGDTIVNFGFDDEQSVPPSLLASYDKFDVDCVTIAARAKNICRSYVFYKDKFWSFSSCD